MSLEDLNPLELIQKLIELLSGFSSDPPETPPEVP